jgi:hypothetical protein
MPVNVALALAGSKEDVKGEARITEKRPHCAL